MSNDRRDASEYFRRHEAAWEAFPGVSLESARAAVGPGWQPLAEHAWYAVHRGGGRVRQVKEKFGTLRAYYDRVAPEAEVNLRERIAELVQESERICEWCGAPGKLRDREYAGSLPANAERRLWWYKTLCDHHAWMWYVDGLRWWTPPDWLERDGDTS